MTVDQELPGRIHGEQVASLFRTVTIGVLGAAFAAIVLAAAMAALGACSPARAAVWALCVAACAVGHILLRRWRATRPGDAWRPWADRFVAVALAEGVCWGWASLFLVTDGRYDQRLIVMLVAYGVAGGSITAFGTYLPALFCFFLPSTVPFAVASLMLGEGEPLAVGLLATVYVFGMMALSRRVNGEFNDALRLRFEVDALATALGAQKDVAEAANLAKSRFLAAASHDLRQPVHALSLSVGALRSLDLPATAATLVGHIEASVEALDGLFTALLDISRLDAAVVTPRPRAFAVQPMLDRVCREHRADALAKGLDLRLAPTGLAVETDPVLLETILRNLVANAVRYTDRGRVLVGCRARGPHVGIEVWDTGRGIALALQDRVFDEFFQVGNDERDRSAGLGLGLAIVRRLTRLLALPLSVRSREGHGSVFRLTVPRADAIAASALTPRVDPAPTLHGSALILIVDDETAVQTAMHGLLTVWGHRVIAAGSCAEMLQRLAHCPDRPDLLICDYRLREGENGIATVTRLQEEYNHDLPAILVTGDTGPDRLVEARASGLPLLHKPVGHAQLRSAIDRLLQRTPTPFTIEDVPAALPARQTRASRSPPPVSG